MDEREMDAYISRCLKNWAAYRQPSADGRQRLLRAASIQPELYRTRLASPIASLIRSILYTQPIVEPDAEWLFTPFTQSRLWSFHMATSSRLTI